ncbi:protein pangolin, isoforms A/H/I/S-like isoform X2 [Actinia tenebrosa]|uniref:Protein pangolin, isoforms A/H/I/S-like isoform X2 n=1 Tax=Actinia tenebrosa TaxID=6105 RepID=A0A6P8I2K9_ACTTE|nr:protein pangolin, isoforms A/H/I/S-like isoform X2 [Actinia tenebrosa]
MPQPPRNSTDDFGADDEVKEYKHEDGEENENGATLDLVNDIKTDLIKKEAEHQEEPKTPTDASSAPIAQLLSFPDKYNEHLVPGHGNYHRNQHSSDSKSHSRGQPQSPVFHPAHQGYPPGPYPYTVYPSIKAERYHYDPPLWQPHGAIIGQSSAYHPNYPPPVNPTTAGIQRLTHPTMTGDQRSGVHCGPAPPPNHSVITRAPPSCGSGKSYTTAMMSDALDHGRDSKLSHVKKPLNAFMLYMKDMRPKVVAECTLKESAAINQILGKKHALERAEQAKYYEMARKERALHMQLYPGWSARDNYAQQGKKKKRKRDKSQEITNPKKCRARYGLDRQNEWCKPCRRKKKCIRFVVGGSNPTDGISAASGISEPENENVDTQGSSTSPPPPPTTSTTSSNTITSSDT